MDYNNKSLTKSIRNTHKYFLPSAPRRIFCFFDQGQLVVLMNRFQKKTQKTPKTEIEKALKIKKEYEQRK